MLGDYWPPHAIRIQTPRLCLRLPNDDELAAIANVAAKGVRAPGEQPFLIPWTDETPNQRAQAILRRHWAQLSGWQPASWQLGLVASHRLRLTAAHWATGNRLPVTIKGLDQARSMFLG